MKHLTDEEKDQIRLVMRQLADEAADKLFLKEGEKGNHRGLEVPGLDVAFREELIEFGEAEDTARTSPSKENMSALRGELIDLWNVSFMSYDSLVHNK